MLETFGQEDRYGLRFLKPTDSSADYFQLLGHLTNSPNLGKDEFRYLVEKINQNPYHYILVAEDTQAKDNPKIIASVTLLVEQKLIHGGLKVGHIEDVVVDPAYRGQGLAQALLNLARKMAKSPALNCYKIILNCTDNLEGFYTKVGYRTSGIEMRQDLNKLHGLS